MPYSAGAFEIQGSCGLYFFQIVFVIARYTYMHTRIHPETPFIAITKRKTLRYGYSRTMAATASKGHGVTVIHVHFSSRQYSKDRRRIKTKTEIAPLFLRLYSRLLLVEDA